ncbi:MAG: ATP-binding protein [Prevotella sp.]|nr:ATP-binding protein [Prevotella sp.]
MERESINQLYIWKNSPERKPLIVRGARQVGKTWLIKEFAKRAFDRFIYVNFEEDEILRKVFENDFNIQRILTAIGLRAHTAIDKHTLLIFDEIQAAPRGLTSLKYFCENARQQPVIAAGSLLGITLHQNDSFPAGKVDFLDLYPLRFTEFLKAHGEQDIVDLLDKQDWHQLLFVRDRVIHYLKTYYFTGGMPEAVNSYVQHKDLDEVRRIQQNILQSYESDFSKHAPKEQVPRIRIVWNSIIGQLSKENRKFLYGLLRQGARAKDFELAIEWLKDAGLIYKVNRTKSGELPLNAFEDFSAFKLFLVDVGLLSAMAKLPSEILIEGDALFSTYKGAFTEQYVCQQLIQSADLLYYWSAENSRGEIDFLMQKKGKVIPIEVKAEENLKARSLRSFVERHPSLHGIRFSLSDYREQEWMTNIPLYAANAL